MSPRGTNTTRDGCACVLTYVGVRPSRAGRTRARAVYRYSVPYVHVLDLSTRILVDTAVHVLDTALVQLKVVLGTARARVRILCGLNTPAAITADQ